MAYCKFTPGRILHISMQQSMKMFQISTYPQQIEYNYKEYAPQLLLFLLIGDFMSIHRYSSHCSILLRLIIFCYHQKHSYCLYSGLEVYLTFTVLLLKRINVFDGWVWLGVIQVHGVTVNGTVVWMEPGLHKGLVKNLGSSTL